MPSGKFITVFLQLKQELGMWFIRCGLGFFGSFLISLCGPVPLGGTYVLLPSVALLKELCSHIKEPRSALCPQYPIPFFVPASSSN